MFKSLTLINILQFPQSYPWHHRKPHNIGDSTHCQNKQFFMAPKETLYKITFTNITKWHFSALWVGRKVPSTKDDFSPQIFREFVDHSSDESFHGTELRVKAQEEQHEEEAAGPERRQGHLENSTGVSQESQTGSWEWDIKLNPKIGFPCYIILAIGSTICPVEYSCGGLD